MMGDRQSVIFFYWINCVACVIFLAQGLLMWFAARPTIEMIEQMKKGGLENVPESLSRHVSADSLTKQQAKLRYCVYASFLALLTVFFSSVLRIVITYDTFMKEKKMFMSFSSMKDH